MSGTFAVFGGTGFLGRRVVRHLLAREQTVRVISRHPERGEALFPDRTHQLTFVKADISADSSVRTAIGGAFGVVNAVSLYVERGDQTFHSMHVNAALRLARLCRECSVTRLVHVSGVGADPVSRSPYVRSRGEGENAVRAEFPEVIIVRPTVMFGSGDSFLTPLITLLRRFPVFPMFGHGRTLLQPAYVEDVGEAIARVLDGVTATDAHRFYEFGGSRAYTYRHLLEVISRRLGKTPILVPMPYNVWRLFAFFAEALPQPVITRNQIELMEIDNVASSAFAGFQDLQIDPQPVEAVLPQLI